MKDTTVINSSVIIIATKDDQIKGLQFSVNPKIEYLPEEVSESFPNLLAYSAGTCSVKSISYENFKGLNKLRGLWLSGNQIEKVSSDTFKDLVLLEHLEFGNQ